MKPKYWEKERNMMHLPPPSHRAIKVAASERCKEGIITFKHCRNDVEELNPEPGT
jgi:hypothetical protein